MIKNILLVEDDQGLQKYLRELFLDNNYAVKVTGDGVEALNALKKSQPDLMVGSR